MSHRELLSFIITLVVSFFCSYFFASAGLFWMPLATILVMQTTPGAAIAQGLKIYLLLLAVVVSLTILLEPWGAEQLLLARCQDLTLGMIIGLLGKHFVLAEKPENIYRKKLIPLTAKSKDFFCLLIDMLFSVDKSITRLAKTRDELETMLMQLPYWIFAKEFNIFHKTGFRHFMLRLEASITILFMMHKSVSYEFDEELLNIFKSEFENYKQEAVKLYDGMIDVLELKKPSSSISDLSIEMENIFAKFKKNISFSLEWSVVSDEVLALTNFIYLLNDLHKTLQSLGQSLSSEVTTGLSKMDSSPGNKSLSPHSDHDPS